MPSGANVGHVPWNVAIPATTYVIGGFKQSQTFHPCFQSSGLSRINDSGAQICRK
jgi:hypothetical protein